MIIYSNIVTLQKKLKIKTFIYIMNIGNSPLYKLHIYVFQKCILFNSFPRCFFKINLQNLEKIMYSFNSYSIYF